MAVELSGSIKQWNDEKGFGFIKSDSAGDVFFHISSLRGDCRPQVGDKVFYIQKKDAQGRLVAEHVRHVELTIDRPSIRVKPREKKAEITVNRLVKTPREIIARPVRIQNANFKIGFFLLLIVLPLWGSVQLMLEQHIFWAAAVYIGFSLVTFYLYWSDKQSAGSGARRIPEARLHFFELLGGWMGALIAQQLFRHKTRKLSYQFIFWLIVIAHELFWFDRVFLGGVYFR